MIISLFPEKIVELLSEIESLGFRLCLVGGAVRDFYSKKILSNDLDFEIRSAEDLSEIQWAEKYQSLIVFFKNKNIKTELLPYLITRVQIDSFNLEFSSPRIENFNNSSDHHNFNAILSSQLKYSESFKRRDFTINSIGVELNLNLKTESCIDPFNGLQDLKNKKLKNIDDAFFRDSVRFIRLIRFQVKYDFEISQELESNLSKFDLSELSDYHFTSEMLKTDPGKFLNKFISLIKLYNFKLPNAYLFFKKINFNYLDDILKTKADVVIYTFFQDELACEEMSQFLKLPKSFFEDLKKYKKAVNTLERFTKDNAKEIIELGNGNFKNHELFSAIKMVNDKREMINNILNIYPDMEKSIKFNYKCWESITVDNSDLMKLEASDRGSFKFFKAIQIWLSDE